MEKPSLGQMIRARRKKIGLTAEELAKKAGVDRTYLSKIERHGALPSPKVLNSIVAHLDDKPNKYISLYESLKFGQWKQKVKSATRL